MNGCNRFPEAVERGLVATRFQLLGAFLVPRIPTEEALWLVDTQHTPAFRTDPFLLLVSHETPDAQPLNLVKVLDHAHAVFRPVAFIQPTETFTRVSVTDEAILELPTLRFFTRFDFAGNAILGFEAVVPTAPWASVLVSIICPTKATVHPAWSDEFRGYRDGLLHVSVTHNDWHHWAAANEPGYSPVVSTSVTVSGGTAFSQAWAAV